MKISTKGRYGLRILLDIAQNKGDAPRLIRNISESQGISEKYVSRLILDLRDGGFLTSLRGAKGGYKLKRNPEEISLLDVIETMEGRVGVVDCLTCPETCKRSENCPARLVWGKVNSKIRDVLSQFSLSDIINGGDPFIC